MFEGRSVVVQIEEQISIGGFGESGSYVVQHKS